MNMKRIAIVVALAGLLGGCEYVQPKMPASIASYEAMKKENRGQYPDQNILLLNRQRMMDDDLSVPERIASMRLVDRLGSADGAVQRDFSTVLSESATPAAMRAAAVDILLAKNQGEYGALLVEALPRLAPTDAQREKIFAWLAEHPSQVAVAGLVQQWAAVRPPTPAQDERFEKLIAQVASKPWDQALINGLNTPAFGDSADAVELLSRLIAPADLRQRLIATPVGSQDMATLQAFIHTFNYVPASGNEFASARALEAAHGTELGSAAKAFQQFASEGYTFNIRDFHLLDMLGQDPIHRPMTRQMLVQQISRNLAATEHVHITAASPSGPVAPNATRPAGTAIDSFDANVKYLSMADLWTIMLLQEMLTRPRVQEGLRDAAIRDRADTTSAWGGLVIYRDGSANDQDTRWAADLERYKVPAAEGRSDYHYSFNTAAIEKGRDALGRFQLHFEKAENALRAGPTVADLADAANANIGGLILTSISDKAFCAHYYTTHGTIVSLGIYPFMDWNKRPQ